MGENLVYLIEKIRIDPFENEISEAVGYEPFGFTQEEEVAKRICNDSRQYTRKDCWAIQTTNPEFRYKPLEQVE
ncbi:hypothetical protein HOI26_02120 [Candidatus Woesearchaeota archaeon]|jgi:hypothetical protein|nr:hypothetical protein [Candidatus Woesearchaeota archaeon]MBT5739873.1 hypothetical protein [Candidatus Woesearchaeota archaeon]